MKYTYKYKHFVTEQGWFILYFVSKQGWFILYFVTEQGWFTLYFVSEQGWFILYFVTEQGWFIEIFVSEQRQIEFLSIFYTKNPVKFTMKYFEIWMAIKLKKTNTFFV